MKKENFVQVCFNYLLNTLKKVHLLLFVLKIKITLTFNNMVHELVLMLRKSFYIL